MGIGDGGKYNSVGFFEEFVGDFGGHIACGEFRGREFAAQQLGECWGEVGHFGGVAILSWFVVGAALLVSSWHVWEASTSTEESYVYHVMYAYVFYALS